MKAIKTAGIISNIVLSVIYSTTSWIFSFFGLMLYVYTPKEPFAVGQIFLLESSIIFLCTVIFCVIGIVLSVVFRKKQKYTASFIIQFLPFFTVLFAISLMIISTILGNT